VVFCEFNHSLHSLMAKKVTPPKRFNDEIRGLILQYFYDRNSTATSAMGTKGAAVKLARRGKSLKNVTDFRCKRSEAT
jgi:hypothetical protein